jgi:hydroxymethylbilane synthase
MEGGCSIPSFALATLTPAGVHLHGGLISLDGKEFIEEKRTTADPQQADTIGVQLAEAVLARGGRKILDDIRYQRTEVV